MNIGPRVWKTGLAVAITLWFTELFALEYGYLAAVAAIISLQPTISDSLKKGWERIQATAIGIALALLAVTTLGSDPLLIGLVVIVTLLICLRYQLTGSIGLATITVVVIMAGVGATTWTFALQRVVILPFVGISIAVAINYLFSPPEHQSRLKDSLLQLNEGIEVLIMRVVNRFLTAKPIDHDPQRDLTERIERRYDEARECLTRFAAERGYRWQIPQTQLEQVRRLERALDILWFNAQRVLDISYLAEERAKRLQSGDEADPQYQALVGPIQEMLLSIVSLERYLVEELFDPNPERRDAIEQLGDDLERRRDTLHSEVDSWQRHHQGTTSVRPLMEMVNLMYDLDRIAQRLGELRVIVAVPVDEEDDTKKGSASVSE